MLSKWKERDFELRNIAWTRANRGRHVYHANVTNRKQIDRYTKDFPVVINLEKGTKTAVMKACRKYLGRSYLYMVNYKICVHKEGTWIYHDGKLYLKNPDDEGIITMAMLTK